MKWAPVQPSSITPKVWHLHDFPHVYGLYETLHERQYHHTRAAGRCKKGTVARKLRSAGKNIMETVIGGQVRWTADTLLGRCVSQGAPHLCRKAA